MLQQFLANFVCHKKPVFLSLCGSGSCQDAVLVGKDIASCAARNLIHLSIRSSLGIMASQAFQKHFSKSQRHTEESHEPCSTSSRTSSLTLVRSQDQRAQQEQLPEPSPKPIEHFVQLCPHETLSFERVQRILALPGFKSSGKRIDALGAITVNEEHSKADRQSHFMCHPCKKGPRPVDYPKGNFNLRFVTGDPYQGLELFIEWELEFFGQDHFRSRARLTHNMRNCGNIYLCPHTKLNDPRIMDRLYRDPVLMSCQKTLHTSVCILQNAIRSTFGCISALSASKVSEA